eukprot:g15800.t1
MTTNSERTHDVVDDWSASFSALRLIKALQRARVDEVCSVLADRKSAKSALLVQGNDCGPSRRTPLMHAVQTGKLSIVTSVMQAFDSLFSSAKHRALEMKKQLLAHDAEGWTVAMLATRAGNVAILMAILEEMIRSGATAALTATDFTRMTLLMHSAAAGQVAGFRQVIKVVTWAFPKDQMKEYLMLKSDDGRTLLMIAAQSSDGLTFGACVDVLRLAINPHDFRMLVMTCDNEGKNVLMHAANPAKWDDGNDGLRAPPARDSADEDSVQRYPEEEQLPHYVDLSLIAAEIPRIV